MTFFHNNPWMLLLVFGGGLTAIAALPSIIAAIRQAEDTTTIVVFNIIGVITLVGWPLALILACITPRRSHITHRPITRR